MTYYGAKELAESFRTVRKNTLIVAEEIPEDQYGFRAVEGTRSVGEMLVHIALGARFQEQVHFIDKRFSMDGFDIGAYVRGMTAESAIPRTKAEILTLLREQGEQWAAALESLSEEFLAEVVVMPPSGSPASRTRFDLLASVKEHEMHHRAQVMLIQRILGITPHLTREREARFAAMRAAGQNA